MATYDEMAAYLTHGYWEFMGQPHPRLDPSDEIAINITDLSEDDQEMVMQALLLWSDVSTLSFVFVTGEADIVFQSHAVETSVEPHPEMPGAQLVRLSQDEDDWQSFNHKFSTIVHEIGHAVGLGHTGPYNSSLGSPDFRTDAIFENDSWQISTMSYFSQNQNPNVDASHAYPLTPQIVDILAIQSLYGVNTTTRGGDDVYGVGNTTGRFVYGIFPEDEFPTVTIYDTGGFDTLNYSGTARDQIIDLNPESFSSVYGQRGNVIIARDTIIEKAIGGDGDDTLIGNAANNVLVGGDGDDTLIGNGGVDELFGEAGEDTLTPGDQIAYGDLYDGGADTDTFDLSGRTGDYLVDLSAGIFDIYTPGPLGPVLGLGTSTLVDIENVIGGNGNDRLVGSAADNVLRGGLGNDVLIAGGGRDRLLGGTGNDTLMPGAGGLSPNQTYDGGQGIDHLSLAVVTMILDVDLATGSLNMATPSPFGPIFAFTPSRVIDIENVTGGSASDSIAGDAGGNVLRGLEGHDTLQGRSGNDTLVGGAGNDVLNGGRGNDDLHGNGGGDSFVFNRNFGDDVIHDFRAGPSRDDVIRIESGLVGSFEAVMAAAAQVGGDVVISLETGDSLTLKGVSIWSLSSDDFVFF
ncbi:M10 family metallopeptidase C-terminal domain-containing protein [Bauldia sp.]|uniref:M10 family metallopeptidase C-terminal domain-containing protein n=1 Tax=Bauldia sp. TaxID=2575872 RepID=UPI003BA87F51